MAKTYEVKVYDQNDNYITTWKDIVSDIHFNNEINSAGGELKFNLARNAGDYGEGTDVSFGNRVKVYVFDNESDGDLLFQGFISAYNPIYKDDYVEVTVLSYGAELNDYIVESGDVAYISQTVNNATLHGYDDRPYYSSFNALAQTFTVAANKTISSVDLKLTTTGSAGFYVQIKEMVGAIPSHSTDPDLATGTINVTGTINAEVKNCVFNQTVQCITSKTYYIEVWASLNTKIHTSSSNSYANGRVYEDFFAGAAWIGYSSTGIDNTISANDDFYFVLYEYGGSTTSIYTSQEPTAILSDIIENYQSRGGKLIEPLSTLAPLISQPLKTILTSTGAWATAHAQIITPRINTTFDTIQINGSGTFYGPLYIYSGNPALDILNVIAGSPSYTVSGSNTLVATSTNSNITPDTNGYAQFYFTNTTLTAGTQYYILYWNNDASKFYTAGASDVISDSQVGNLYRAEVNVNNSSTAMAITSSYKAIYLDLLYLPDGFPANANGGYISTDTSVSYTFKIQTMYEAINVLKDLAPENWYWYVEQGTNEIIFKEKSVTPDHTFSLEKDIIDARFEKRTEDIVNTLYFTGGDTGSGTNFFKKYTDAESIATYGVKSAKYNDTRVTTSATADLIGNNIIATKSQPELRVTIEILDSNNNQGLGYDIESIKIGDVIAVRNITQQVGLNTWDYGKWDEAYWDYNIYNLASLELQIQKIDYNEDRVTITASTLPVDVTKRIDTINRKLSDLQTVNNPTTPS